MKTAIRILSLAIAISVSSRAWAGTSPDPAPPSNEGPSPAVQKKLAEQITLDLENASVKATIEKVAIILGTTPLFAPGVEDGPITIRVKAISIARVLDVIRSESKLQIQIWGDRLLVSNEAPAAGTAPSVRSLLADPAVPKRLEATPAPPRRPVNFLDLHLDSGVVRKVTVTSSDVIEVPGCSGALGYMRFGADAFDGKERAVFFDGAKGSPTDFGRFVVLGSEPVAVRMAGCEFRVRPQETSNYEALSSAYVPEAVREQYIISSRIVEVFESEERLLSSPRVQTSYRQLASVQSGSQVNAPEGPVDRTVRLQVAVVARRDSGQRLLAAVGAVNLLVPTPEGRTQVRIAYGEETIWMTPGRTERITLATTRGQQPSAVVVELTLEVLTR